MDEISVGEQKRPFAVTWLAYMVFILSAGNMLGVYGGLTHHQILTSLELELPGWASVIFSGTWMVIWLILGWGLVKLAEWARRATIAAVLIYVSALAGRQVFFVRGAYERGRTLFVFITLFSAAAVSIIILTRPRVRKAFEETAEQSGKSEGK
jgi:hypothetical protein